MSDFRNKQWFKNLSDKEKKSLCKRYGCTEQGLKRAGHIEDGKLKIDLLRLEMEFPSEWMQHLEIVESEEFKSLLSKLNSKEDTYDILLCLEEMYNLWGENKYLKPDLKKGNIVLWINSCKLFVNKAIETIELNRDSDASDKTEVMATFARKVYTQLKMLFESELNNIKK